MKNLIFLFSILFLIGCGDSIHGDDVRKAIKHCEKYGGLVRIDLYMKDIVKCFNRTEDKYGHTFISEIK